MTLCAKPDCRFEFSDVDLPYKLNFKVGHGFRLSVDGGSTMGHPTWSHAKVTLYAKSECIFELSDVDLPYKLNFKVGHGFRLSVDGASTMVTHPVTKQR